MGEGIDCLNKRLSVRGGVAKSRLCSVEGWPRTEIATIHGRERNEQSIYITYAVWPDRENLVHKEPFDLCGRVSGELVVHRKT